MAQTPFKLSKLTPEQRSKLKTKTASLLRSLEELEKGNKAHTSEFDACGCSCDCDPNDPSSTQAFFGAGKALAGLAVNKP
ncbi:MAG: hypothetical protein WA188_14710 [Terriglobales bacterium]